jgi:hypothetical protein
MSTEPFNGNVGKMKASNKWLASEDFIGMKPVELTIEGVFKDTGEVMQDGKKKDFFSVAFAKTEKRLVLNATNRKALAFAFGSSTQGWIGKKILLWAQDGVKAIGGGTTTGLRLKSAEPETNPLLKGDDQ